MRAEEKFLKYVTYDTQSDEYSDTAPSTAKQLILADELLRELQALGVEESWRDAYGTVYGRIAPLGETDRPSIGLIAHMDTASELSGANVRAQIIENYDGGVIQLNEQYSMSPELFDSLNRVIGDDLIVTDGTTLLGSDDKGGLAIIMQTIEELLASGKDHGEIFVAFTPDEEIGRGVLHFDLDSFQPDFAYTIDGEDIRCVDYETFNAAMAYVKFTGRAVHPGSAKGKMINAAAAAVEFASMLPQWQRPEFTEGREGFMHLLNMSGECEQASLQYLIRDHDRALFERKKDTLKLAADLINERYGNCIDLEIRDQYYNMKDFMNGDFRAVELAREALVKEGIDLMSLPVRGGTDGAMLTARGLITPNLGTGGGNCHGRFEFASIQKMNKMVDVLHHILED